MAAGKPRRKVSSETPEGWCAARTKPPLECSWCGQRFAVREGAGFRMIFCPHCDGPCMAEPCRICKGR